MKPTSLANALLLSFNLMLGSCQAYSNPKKEEITVAEDSTHIQVALLLDTSNSMDGLIDQAKSRLWNIINTLTTLKYKGKSPAIEIALYEYGNDGLSAKSDYIRQVTPLTTDLDVISEKLFALRTNGGSEYCGAVINEAVQKLSWGSAQTDMKLVYIAGNEPFDQGKFSYKEAVSAATGKTIFVNTIFCGNYEEGVSTFWKDGANRGQGKYFNIDSDRKVIFIETPYDKKIEVCNERINKTYIGYGSLGSSKKSNQAKQDLNARSISSANVAERTVSKSKSAYKNVTWDLVDLAKEDKTALSKISTKDLPQELQGKTPAELEAIIAEKTKEREAIQKEISELAKQRQAYIDNAQKNNKQTDDLGAAINTSIVTLAKAKGYTIEQ